MSERNGKLVIVGTGIRSLGQLTLEAIEQIEKADKIYYAFRDAVTEGFIKGKNKNTVNLDRYYLNDETTPKVDAYIQMAEVMVTDVRKGLHVVGVFYGHPGLFMSPTRRALAIAQAEGYTIKMLPGISSEDCLMADLGIDPSFAGCVTTDAPAFLFYDRPLLTSSHVIMYEVGQLGLPEPNLNEFDHFELFVRKLEKVYGSLHPMVNYTGAISPIMTPVIDRLMIGDLYKPEIRKLITYSSTFYFPPREQLPFADYAQQVVARGLATDEQLENAVFPINPIYQLEGTDPLPAAYTEYAKKAIAALHSRKFSSTYRAYSASPAMQGAMEKITLSIEVLETYLRDPVTFAKVVGGLEDAEREALASGDFSRINAVMTNGRVHSGVKIYP